MSVYALLMPHRPCEGQELQGLYSASTDPETNLRFSPTSQTPAVDDFQLSGLRSDAAFDLDVIHPHDEKTISTTSSNESGRVETHMSNPVERDLSPVARNENIDGLLTDWKFDQETMGAPKRLVNGELKHSQSRLPTSPVEPGQYGQSRNSSRTSQISQVGEMSVRLRTRLSYAMIKVQNGWQSQNISELEKMTSNKGLAVSDAHRSYDRHFATTSPTDRSVSNLQLTEPGTAAPDDPHFSPLNSATTPELMPGRRYRKYEHSSRTNKVGAAYESFWRDHKDASRPVEAPLVGPSLAPPADIVACSPRRLDATKKKPPPLRTPNLDTDSTLVTPPSKQAFKIRTPSQQAEVEKDAVETLLFMSSPGNSDYHPPGTCAHFFKSSEDCVHSEQFEHSRSQYTRSPARKRTLSDAEMNRMLDRTSDTSSSDEGGLKE